MRLLPAGAYFPPLQVHHRKYRGQERVVQARFLIVMKEADADGIRDWADAPGHSEGPYADRHSHGRSRR